MLRLDQYAAGQHQCRGKNCCSVFFFDWLRFTRQAVLVDSSNSFHHSPINRNYLTGVDHDKIILANGFQRHLNFCAIDEHPYRMRFLTELIDQLLL